jgi:mono/diheme cytochrome c family protein
MANSKVLVAAAAIGIFVACIPAYSADSAAGQKIYSGACAACHQLKSYAGKSDADLETQIKGIVAGTIKHPKKLTLSDDDVASVAAYISGNEPK